MVQVAIVVLSYNSRQVTRRCLESLRRLSGARVSIVVVDNGSTDGTEDMVRGDFSDFAFIQTGSNLGYTGGNNRGIDYALDHGADYVLLLNPDTELLNPSFVEEMVEYMETHSDVGIAGPRVFLRQAGVVQNTVLFVPSFWRNLIHWVRYRFNSRFSELSGTEVVEAEVLNGVCVMLKAECLRQIGLFDENIFMYVEDVELDYRARRQGWHVRYLPIDSVIHLQKREGYHMTGQVAFLLKRNIVYFLHKVGRRLDAWGYAGISLVMLAVRGLMPFTEESFAEHAALCRRLATAYWQILTGQALDKSFGPPYS